MEVEQAVQLATTIVAMAVEASENHIRRLTAIANDDEDIITLLQGRTDSQRYYWVGLAQSEALWLTFQNQLVLDIEWNEMFRMSHESFNILLGLLEDDLVKQDTKFRLAIPPAKRLAIALFYLL